MIENYGLRITVVWSFVVTLMAIGLLRVLVGAVSELRGQRHVATGCGNAAPPPAPKTPNHQTPTSSAGAPEDP